MAENLKSNLTFFKPDRMLFSVLFIILFFGFSIGKISTQAFVFNDKDEVTTNVTEIVETYTEVSFDVVFVGYNQDYVDVNMIDGSLDTTAFYEGIDYIYIYFC